MIIIASDKFKGTYSANSISNIIGERVRRQYPDSPISILPMADGGEGTAEIFAKFKNLSQERLKGINPYGTPILWEIYRKGEVAAIDSASAVGLSAAQGLVYPMNASSFPLGLLIKQLAEEGVRQLYVGVGGTMTTDCGAGCLQALGWRFLNQNDREIRERLTPNLLSEIRVAIPPEITPTQNIKITALIDVDVPLLPTANRSDGLSALSFAPQKGVTPSEIKQLHQSFQQFENIITNTVVNRNIPTSFCGAGGGLGFALQIIGANASHGAEIIWKEALAQYNIVPNMISHIYTGEGCFDMQSFQGKVTGQFIKYGVNNSIPVTIICGRCEVPSTIVPSQTKIILLKDFITK